MRKLELLRRRLADPSGPEAFALATRVFRGLFGKRYPFHWPDLDWISDEPFWELLEQYGERTSLNAHRRKLLYEFALRSVRGAGVGVTAECGAFKGLGSHLICRALLDSNCCHREHFIFDSFEGLSRPSAADGRYWSEGDLACDETSVRKNLAKFDFIRYFKGWIPDRFPEIADRQFSFVHIDVDLAVPTQEALAFFFPRLRAGGAIIVDDYGFASCPGVTDVVNRFVVENDTAVLVRSPVGGCILEKLGDKTPTERTLPK
jgi:hypothetical protein